MEKYDVVIIGGGPAGISAAIWCSRLGLNHLLLETNDRLGGQLLKVHNKIIDYPGVLTENGLELQKRFEEQVAISNCKINYIARVTSIDPEEKKIFYEEGNVKKYVLYQFLVLATGSQQRSLNVPGEKEMLERGEVYSATRDRHRFQRKNVAIVGGGDRAFEGAILLAEAGANVFLIHHSTSFRAKKMYKEKAFQLNNIELITNATVQKIYNTNQVEGVEIFTEGDIKRIPVAAVFVRIGVSPNNQLVKDLVKIDKEGYIIVDKMGKSSNEYIFAIGDVCNTTKYSSIAASVGQGMIAIKHIYEILHDKDSPIYL